VVARPIGRLRQLWNWLWNDSHRRSGSPQSCAARHRRSGIGRADEIEVTAMSDFSLATDRATDLSDVVRRCDEVLAHAWMVRTFIKHCEEIDDYTELMGIVRSVFDISRALETRLADPVAYLRMLHKKLSKLRQATAQFQIDALKASTHTNFQQAVKSMNVCVRELQSLSVRGQELLAALPTKTFAEAEPSDEEEDQ